MNLPFLRTGSGVPLILVHGYLGGSAQWHDQISAFSTTHDVIAPDLPGFGGAAGLPAPKSIAGFAAAVVDLINRLGVNRFLLLGHSMGGMIAQEIAARHTDRIDALLLYGTGPLGVMPDRFETIETSLHRLEEDGITMTADRISAQWFHQGSAAPGYPATRDIARMASLEAGRNGLTAMRDWDGRSALEQLSMRSRIVWGDQDRSYRWPQIAALWNGIAGAELSVIPGTSHAVHMEKPHLFNAVIQDFLEGH